MAALDPYLAKALLDWSLGGATPTRPVGQWLDLASGSPNTSGSSAAPVTRQTISFQAASTIAGASASASKKNVNTFSATAACTIFGWNLYDASQGGNRLIFGTVTASATGSAGQTFSITAARLFITLA